MSDMKERVVPFQVGINHLKAIEDKLDAELVDYMKNRLFQEYLLRVSNFCERNNREIWKEFESYNTHFLMMLNEDIVKHGKKISQKTAALAESAQTVTTD